MTRFRRTAHETILAGADGDHRQGREKPAPPSRQQGGRKFFGLLRSEIVGKASYDLFQLASAELIVSHDRQLLESRKEVFIDARSPQFGCIPRWRVEPIWPPLASRQSRGFFLGRRDD
jgi:hypothetical protein